MLNGTTIKESASEVGPTRVSGDTTVTAFVHSWDVVSQTHVIAFVETRGRASLRLDVSVERLPRAFGHPKDSQLPDLWLRYFGLMPK